MFSEGKCFHVILRGEKEERLNSQGFHTDGWFPLAPLTEGQVAWINEYIGGLRGKRIVCLEDVQNREGNDS